LRQVEYVYKALLPLVAQFGSIIGIAITSPITRWLGYKRTALVMLTTLGALVCLPFFSQNGPMLLVGFMLQGIPWGVFQVVSPAYASEVASIQLRPILTTWNNLCWVIGQLLAAAIVKGFQSYPGEFSYRIPFAFEWVFTVLLLITIFFAPESPYWHIQRNDIPAARQCIKKMVRKGDPSATEAKLALMRHTVYQESKEDEEGEKATGIKGYLQRCGRMFRGVDGRRTEISCVAWLIQSLCGSSIIPWAPKLMEASGLNASQALSMNVALPVAGIMGTVASWWLMQVWGRRRIYLVGLAVMALFLVGCGFASFAPGNLSGFIAGGILTGYTAIYDLTIGPICYSIVSEIPSIRYRTSTLSAARGAYLVAGLVNHFLTPKMVGSDEESWGWGAKTGFLYAGFCVLGAVYTWYRIPETNGLSTRALDILFQHKVKAKEFSAERALVMDNASPASKTSHTSVHDVAGQEKSE